MMEQINIGLLLPTSTIFPISRDFEKGFKEALTALKASGVEIELVKEFIGQGDLKAVESVCNKLFNYDNVDLVVSFISNKVAAGVAEKFAAKQTPLLASNIGGHIPDINALNEYVFTNSLQLWRHAWTLGNYGVKHFGQRGMFIGSVYDAGYGFSQMFHEGMQAADKNSHWCFSVPPMPPAGQLSNMDVIFPYLKEYEPDFVFAAFCGGETTLFLNEFIRHGWHKKTKLMGLPYLLTPFQPLNDDITIYTTALSSDPLAIAPAKAFYYLGQQAGNTVAAACANAIDKETLKNELAKLNTLFNVSRENNDIPGTDVMIPVIEHTITAGADNFSSVNLTSYETFGLNTTLMAPLTQGINASWYNPYLCI